MLLARLLLNKNPVKKRKIAITISCIIMDSATLRT
jgi:hypothetical protein